MINEKIMIRISKDVKEALRIEAAKRGLALATYIRMILTAQIERKAG
jgi:predicted DNA binding CopG/RHH family protein